MATSITSGLILKRDLADVVSTIAASSASFVSSINLTSPGTATQFKHEWMEMPVEYNTDTITEAVASAQATSLVVAHPERFMVGMILAFKSIGELLEVTAINTGTSTLTVTRGYGGTSAASAYADNSVVKIVNRPRVEFSLAEMSPEVLPNFEYNQTEIFDMTVGTSGTLQASSVYSATDYQATQVATATSTLIDRLNKAVLVGARVDRAASPDSRGSMRGVLRWIGQVGGNILDVNGDDLDAGDIDSAYELAYSKGGNPNVILVSPYQARKLQALYAGTVTVLRTDTVRGTQVLQIVTDLGGVGTIFIDRDVPQDVLALVDPSKVSLFSLPGRTFKEYDATIPGTDGTITRVLGEYTVEVKNAKEAHAIIVGLT